MEGTPWLWPAVPPACGMARPYYHCNGCRARQVAHSPASGQPASVVTLVLIRRSDWFEAHASGVVVMEAIGMWPDAAGTGASFPRRSIARSDDWPGRTRPVTLYPHS